MALSLWGVSGSHYGFQVLLPLESRQIAHFDYRVSCRRFLWKEIMITPSAEHISIHEQ